MNVQWWHITIATLAVVVGWLINALRLHRRNIKVETSEAVDKAAATTLLSATVASTARDVTSIQRTIDQSMVTKHLLQIAVLELKQEMQKLFNDRYYTRKEADSQDERITRLEKAKDTT